MNILLLGHRGYLGSYLREKIDVDILTKRNVYDNEKKYDYVINCIGHPNLEYCEENIDTTNYSNRDVITDIIYFYPEAKIINFSSYYVYNDTGHCSESSKTTDAYHYCRQKLEAEALIQKGVSFRVGKLFGHKDINKQNKLTEHIIKNDDLTLDTVLFNPTSLEQCTQAVKYEIHNNNLQGIFNLSNDGFVSHYEYGKKILKLLGTDKKIKKIDRLNKSFDSYGNFLMCCDKIKKYFPLSPWEKDLQTYLATL